MVRTPQTDHAKWMEDPEYARYYAEATLESNKQLQQVGLFIGDSMGKKRNKAKTKKLRAQKRERKALREKNKPLVKAG